jgi:hypothetical protein
MERKLAAILAADVASYSRLMEADEEGTLNALRSHRRVVDGFILNSFHALARSDPSPYPLPQRQGNRI